MKLIFGLLFSMLAFQNCAKTNFTPEEKTEVSSKTERGGHSKFNFVRQYYYHHPVVAHKHNVAINLDEGMVHFLEYSPAHYLKSCKLAQYKIDELDQIINGYDICEVKPQEDEIVCKALGLPEYDLYGPDKSVALAPIVCKTGRVLCDEGQDRLREYFKGLTHARIGEEIVGDCMGSYGDSVSPDHPFYIPY